MGNPTDKTSPAGTTTALHERAEQNLRYIRDLMEGSASFTGVSGAGYLVAGLTAIAAAWLAARQPDAGRWLLVWMIELLVGASITFSFTISKARRQGESLWSTTGKKLLLAFIPPMLVGAVLTLFLAANEAIPWLPGIWLSLYGAAVIAAGAYSVPVIPLMGAALLGLGSGTLLLDLPGDLMLALGLGGLHVLFGLIIWRKHGG